jgi:hypothetical protein
LEYHGGKVYKDSKLANILMTRQAAKTFPNSITSVCFNPGFIPSTGLFSSLREESWWKAQALTLYASIMGFSIPLEVAGERLVYLATVPQLPNGSYFCAPVKSKATTPKSRVDLPSLRCPRKHPMMIWRIAFGKSLWKLFMPGCE